MLVKIISNEDGVVSQVQFTKTDKEPTPTDFKAAVLAYLKKNHQMNEKKVWENLANFAAMECMVDVA